jgi:hypothetical protein
MVKLLAEGCDMLGYGKRSNGYAAVGYGVHNLLEECGERSTGGENVVNNQDVLTSQPLGAYDAE